MERDLQPKDKLQRFYNEWYAKRQDSKFIARITDRYCNWILNLLDVQPKKRILDVSCGEGNLLRMAERRGLEIFGIDLSEVAIREASKKVKKVRLSIGNAEHLPHRTAYFDYVTCLGSLEHFLHSDKGVKEIARVLKPEGRTCIYLPNSYFIGHIYFALCYGIPPSEAGQDFSESFRTRVGWQRLLEENGLRVLRTYRYNTIWATKKVGKATLLFYNLLIKYIIPFNLSYSFAYICQKI